MSTIESYVNSVRGRNKMTDKKQYSDADKAPLTPEENAKIREIISEEEFQRRLWTAVRLWFVWIGGIATTAYMFRDGIAAFFKGLVK